MDSVVKIHHLEVENMKRIRAVKLTPSASGLTVVGGNNNQGKTSVIDAIAWALGGDKYRPSNATREGSMIPPTLRVVLDNGLVVERKGKNADLKVTDPNGGKSGQQLLNEFVEQLALDMPRFLAASSREKAATLLQTIGVGEQLAALDRAEQELYNQRTAIGQIGDRKKKFAEEMPTYLDAPKELISASELIRKQQDILARNGENQRKRRDLAMITEKVNRLTQQLADMKAQLAAAEVDLEIAQKSARDLLDESTEELENSIRDIEEINRKVRANLDKDKAEEDAAEHGRQYRELTGKIETIRSQRISLLDNANLPLPGLSVEDGELVYNGKRWDCMSASEQLRVSTAIVRRLNPKCGFVLLDKLEQMDLKTLSDFCGWLEQEGLQAIATRVSTGDECSIIIEDGYAVPAETQQAATWKEGSF